MVAGACDAAENATLLRVLGGRHDLAPVARRFALAKFALLGLGWAAAAARRLG